MRRLCRARAPFVLVLVTPWLVSCGDDAEPATDTSAPTDTAELTDTNVDTVVDTSVTDATSEIDVPPGSILLTGSVQKGPFVVGSSVVVAPLDPGSLQPTGQSYLAQTRNDRGEFEVVFEADGPVAVEGEGFYYNEITGALSSAELTLRAFFVPSGTGPQEAFLNLVTHLTTERIKVLVGGGASFAVAVAQAEGELFAELDLTRDGYTPALAGIRLNVLGGDNDDNAYLLLMSATLLQTANARPAGSLEAKIQELLNQMALDLGDGSLTAPLKDEIRAALIAVDLALVESQLAARFALIGSTQPVPDMARVADQDGDGLANTGDNCPKIANATQGNGDGDRYGDVCDLCPTTDCDGLCIPGSTGGAGDACFATCDTDAECAGGSCLILPTANDVDPARGGGLRFCGATCDPLASTCTAGQGCAFAFGLDETYRWACVPSALIGLAEVGDRCTPRGRYCVEPTCPPIATDCLADLVCWCGPEVMCTEESYFVCRTVCRVSEAAATCGEQSCLEVGSGTGLCELAPGEVGDPCEVVDPGTGESTCAAELACGFDQALCADSGAAAHATCCVPAGDLGEACYPGEACNAGLVCIDQHSGTIDGPRCAAAGALDEPCLPERVCDAGLVCRHAGPNADCGDDFLNECCMAAGGLGEACLPDDVCDPGLGCVSDWGACGQIEPPCCVAAAGPLEHCADKPCTAGYVCADPGDLCTGQSPCCIPSPDLGDDCYGQPICGAGAFCKTDDACASGSCCAESGLAFSACASASEGPRCAAGFACIDETCLPYDGTCTTTSQTCANPDTSCNIMVMEPSWPSNQGACVLKQGEGEICRGRFVGSMEVSLGCIEGVCVMQDPGAPASWTCDPVGTVGMGDAWGCCVSPGGDGDACHALPELCTEGLACIHTGSPPICPDGLDWCCRAPGEIGQACVNYTCTSGAACHQGYCVGTSGECIDPAGGGQPTCPTPATHVCVGYRCLSWGGLHEPCGPACDGGLACVNGVCETSGGAGEACGDASACDEGLVCIPNHGSSGCDTGANQCCHAAGALGEPCLADGTCATTALVCLAISDPSTPWGQECVTGQAVGQPCDADHPCTSVGYCAGNDAVCGMGVTCCQARQPVGGACEGDAARCLPGLACRQTTFEPCPDGLSWCCVASGGEGEACTWPTNGCDDADLACFDGRCVEAGAAGEPCRAGGLCDAPTIACVSGMCRASLGACGIGGSCPIGSACRQGLCLETGDLWQACNADGACDDTEGLVCASTWEAPMGACLNDYPTCCQPTDGP